MKKVISALTAAVMTASASASVLSAFAAYTSGSDVGYYLKVTSTGNYTVSDDGKTITFATKEDAAGASFTVGHYINADTSAPSIQQIGGMIEVDSSVVKTLDGRAIDGKSIGKETTVTDALGHTFTTDQFVNAFAYYDDFAEEFSQGTGSMSYNVLKSADGEYTDGKDAINWTWAYNFANEGYADGTGKDGTAHFVTTKSDDFPVTEVDITLADAIADGTYTVDWQTNFTHPKYGATDSTFMNTDGVNVIVPATLEGITIVVGSEQPTDAPTDEPTDAPTDEPTDAPTDEPTDAPTDEPTEPSQGEKTHDKFEWEIGNVVFDPAVDTKITVPIVVWNCEPLGAYSLDLSIDGLDPADADFPFSTKLRLSDKGALTNQNTYVANTEYLTAIANTDTSKDDPDGTIENGATVIELILAPKDGYEYTPGKKFVVAFDANGENKFSNNQGGDNGTVLTPVLTNGSITVAGGDPVEPTTEPPTDEPTDAPTDEPTDAPTDEPTDAPTDEPTDAPTDEPTDAPQPGQYIYGDVNKNGTVELVDIVMLNRFLTKYDGQDLDDYQVVVANCYRTGESDADTTKDNLNGKDSVEILRYLIGLVASLPTQG